MDSPDPHYATKLASVKSADELQGFHEQLRRERGERGQQITTDELAAVIRRGVEIKRKDGRE